MASDPTRRGRHDFPSRRPGKTLQINWLPNLGKWVLRGKGSLPEQFGPGVSSISCLRDKWRTGFIQNGGKFAIEARGQMMSFHIIGKMGTRANSADKPRPID